MHKLGVIFLLTREHAVRACVPDGVFVCVYVIMCIRVRVHVCVCVHVCMSVCVMRASMHQCL